MEYQDFIGVVIDAIECPNCGMPADITVSPAVVEHDNFGRVVIPVYQCGNESCPMFGPEYRWTLGLTL